MTDKSVCKKNLMWVLFSLKHFSPVDGSDVKVLVYRLQQQDTQDCPYCRENWLPQLLYSKLNKNSIKYSVLFNPFNTFEMRNQSVLAQKPFAYHSRSC